MGLQGIGSDFEAEPNGFGVVRGRLLHVSPGGGDQTAVDVVIGQARPVTELLSEPPGLLEMLGGSVVVAAERCRSESEPVEGGNLNRRLGSFPAEVEHPLIRRRRLCEIGNEGVGGTEALVDALDDVEILVVDGPGECTVVVADGIRQ